MTDLQALLLGIVQGATEFLPISSSGHLVLVPWVLGWDLDVEVAFTFDVLVHWGTLSAVVLFFREDLADILGAVIRGLRHRDPFGSTSSRLGWLILVASLPAALAGMVGREAFADAFQNPPGVSAFLLLTAAILALGERVGKRSRRLSELGFADSLWVGLSQVVALLPGISRSGSTIAGGLARGFRREDAARFSFLMAVPVMVGAGLIALMDLASSPDALVHLRPLAIGFASSALSGYLAIRWLLAFLSRRSLFLFTGYCLLAGLATLALAVVRG